MSRGDTEKWTCRAMVGLLVLARERAGGAEITGSLTRNSMPVGCPISITSSAALRPILP
jgi:hypothetical protein